MRWAVTLLALCTGCSFAFVRGPPAPPIQLDAPVDCTESRSVPISDVAMGVPSVVLGLAVGIAASQSCDSQKSFCILRGPSVAVPAFAVAAAGLAYLVSAGTGFARTSACRDAVAWWHGCRAGDEAACKSLQGQTLPSERLVADPPPACTAQADCFERGGFCIEGACRR